MTPILLEHADGIARIVLQRPDAGNAIDLPLAQALKATVEQVASDPAVRCVVLTGAGRMFCVGGDVGLFAEAGDNAPAMLRDLADTLHSAVATLTHMAKPLLVLVNGPAAGAGLSLALLGDIVIAARSAHFTAAYTGIGLTPDGGMSWLLPRVAGLRVAQEMILTNRRVGSEEAQRIGVVTNMVEDQELSEAGHMMAGRLADAPTAAIGAARGLMLAGATAKLETQLDSEAAAIAAAGGRAESREGIAAFLARRKPNFRKL
jgi:2-(1,2-epoxy-1,2-dihydrophenyl)acetyl-CoA isomerase